MNTGLEAIELYPKIVVYKNMFKDISKTYQTLLDSETVDSNDIFTEWSQWSSFGKYLNPVSKNIIWNEKDIEVDLSSLPDTSSKDQKDFIDELIKNFKTVSLDYSNKYNINLDQDSGWRWTAPVICKYDNIVDEDRKMTMRYHSDYIWEPIASPGYKFAITALVYFNDNYDGGEIDFAVGKNLIKYKPSAGDFIVFPSGHPEILTENSTVYLHGVMPVTGSNNKIFSRMFWQKYQPGSEEWHKKEKEYGKDQWEKMQDDIMKDFRKQHPQRNEIKNGVRLA
jgi:hypothetical protein